MIKAEAEALKLPSKRKQKVVRFIMLKLSRVRLEVAKIEVLESSRQRRRKAIKLTTAKVLKSPDRRREQTPKAKALKLEGEGVEE